MKLNRVRFEVDPEGWMRLHILGMQEVEMEEKGGLKKFLYDVNSVATEILQDPGLDQKRDSYKHK